MYGDIPYKFKYILNKIVNCLIQYIMNNLSNHLLVESKLILINNYIIDVFKSREELRNGKKLLNHNSHKNPNSNTFIDKSVSNKIITPIFGSNVTLSKFNHVFLNLGQKDFKENINKSNNEKIGVKISAYKEKEKFKLIRLRKLLKDEQEKSMMKELSYLKRLSLVQEKLNFYETIKGNSIKAKNSLEIDNKINPNSFRVNEEKIAKSKMNKSMNNNIKLSNKDYLTLINCFRNRRINLFYPNTTRVLKHSVSQKKISDKN